MRKASESLLTLSTAKPRQIDGKITRKTSQAAVLSSTSKVSSFRNQAPLPFYCTLEAHRDQAR